MAKNNINPSPAANDPTTTNPLWLRLNLRRKELANRLLYALAILAPAWIVLMHPPHSAIAFVWAIVFLRLVWLKK